MLAIEVFYKDTSEFFYDIEMYELSGEDRKARLSVYRKNGKTTTFNWSEVVKYEVHRSDE